MNNDEKVQDLIKRTRDWNQSRGIPLDDGALVFDVYLDRIHFDLYMEVDLEKEEIVPINENKVKDFKYLTVKNLRGTRSIEKLFKNIRK
tara:strand:- start:396 stop:662 length:267 start_codon:yes stop_codon:yes gene_type:complete